MFQNAKQLTQLTREFKHDTSPISASEADLTAISDSELFNLCKQFGDNALKWRWKFAGLLPEVNRRLLYKKKGYSCIFEFAARLAGMSREQVLRTLSLDKKFDDKPALRNLLTNGEVSVNKLARVASIATNENQNDLAERVKVLSKNAIEAFVKDEKRSVVAGDFVPGHNDRNYMTILSALSEKLKNELLGLVEKGINIEVLIAEMLNNRKTEIAIAKEQIVAKIGQEGLSAARYIPVEIRKIIKQEYGTKCAVPTCKNPAMTIHHTHRFALAKNHNPYYLAPLCRGHHEIAHNIDMKYGCERAVGATGGSPPAHLSARAGNKEIIART